jgi:hypothetical protein
MTPVFDIFRTEEDGSLHWCETAPSLEAATNRVREIGESTSAKYVIVDQETGEHIIVEAPTPASPPQSTNPTRTSQGWYHICRVDKEKLRWVEAAETLQIAETRIKVLKAFFPGDYLVLDYNPERSDSPPPWTPLTVVLSALGF